MGWIHYWSLQQHTSKSVERYAFLIWNMCICTHCVCFTTSISHGNAQFYSQRFYKVQYHDKAAAVNN